VIPRQRWEPQPTPDTWAAMWPEVEETREAVSMMTADTVLQILHGQGLTWGLGATVAGDGRQRHAPDPHQPHLHPKPPDARSAYTRITCPVCGMNVAARPTGWVIRHKAYELEPGKPDCWVWCPASGVQLHPGSIERLRIHWDR